MFRIESYITPIIIKNLEKYVKNIRPQELQLSLWGGEVAFQNLDLRLDVLEEELNLPFNFLSGHIHEIIIKLPWTKIASESISVTINTIEFVLKLKDLNDRTPVVQKKDKKKKISRDDELQTPPGYMANLVNKIANNISIKCNNVILKYIEEDIVVSMNIQQVSFDAADDLWNSAFVDTSPLKVILRKIVNIQDLTICLDKRNSSGKIEVCQEPILYRSTFVIRLLKKYNVATAHRSSSTRIDVHTKSLHLNISTQQFPMIMRLVVLMQNLKQGNLKQPQASGSQIDGHVEELGEENGESFFSWAWNMLPSIFPSEEDEEDEQDIKGHIIHAGLYVDQFKISLKSQEIFGDPIVYATKKIKYVPFLSIILSGIYCDSIILAKSWFNMRGGVTDISIDSVGDCTCGAKQDTVSIFTTYNNAVRDRHYKNTLMDSDESEENLSRLNYYNFNWDSHIANVEIEKLLDKTPALAFDMVHQVEIPDDYGRTSDIGSDLEYSNLSEKTLCRILVGPFKITHSTTLDHIIETIREYVKLYDYPPYVSEKPEPSLIQLSPPSTDDYDALMSEIPLLVYHVSIFKPSFEMSMCDHKKPKPAKKSTFKPQIMPKNKNEVSCTLEIGQIEMKCIFPLYPNRLVFTTCQLPEPPLNLFEACYNKFTLDLKSITLNLKCNEIKVQLLLVPTIEVNLKILIRPDLWLKKEIPEILADVIIQNVRFHGNRPQMALLNTFLTQNNDEWPNNTTSLGTKLIADLANGSLLMMEFNLYGISIKAIQNKTLYSTIFKIEHCSGKDQKYLFLSSQGGDPFIQIVAQFPRYSDDDSTVKVLAPGTKSFDEITTPPVFLLQISEIVINVNSNIVKFLNWSSKSEDSELDTINEEAKFMERDPENTPKKTLDAKINRKYSNKLGSIHSSSEKDTATTMVKPELVKQEPVNCTNDTDWSKLYNLCNCTILNVELKQITIYTTNCDFKSANDISIENVLLTHPESDIVILKLPNVLISSSHLKSSYGYLNLKIPLEFPAAIWKRDRDGFPWNMAITELSVLTIQNLNEFLLVNPIKTNISLAITMMEKEHNADPNPDEPPFSVFLHIDTSATCLNLYENQIKLFLSTLNTLLSLQILQASQTKVTEKSPPLEIAQRPVSPDSTVDLKEFLGISHVSESVKDSVTVVVSQTLDDDTKLCPQIPILLQWTLTKFSIQLFSSTDTDNFKLAIDFEDIISSVDRQLIYTKVKAKIGSISCEFYEKEVSRTTWNLNESFGFNIRTDQNNSVSSNINTFFDMTLTRAETGNVHTKWGTNKKDQSLNDFLTEIMINMQQIDIRIEFGLMAKFLPIINALSANNVPQKQTASDETINVVSVADLPLIYFESKGIRVFIPTENNQKNCNVCIIKINQIVISPNIDNPITRIPVRPDIYTKAAQLRILNARGSKIEDRQYEFLLKGISMATGNWKELSTFIENSSVTILHANPAFEWNNKQNIKHTLDINTIFKDFDFSVIFAPAIVYRNVLVCGPGLELNCLTDLIIDLSSPQISLANIISNKIASLTSSDLKPVKKNDSFQSDDTTTYQVVSEETNLPKKTRFYGASSESVSTENLLTDSGIGSQKNEKRNKFGKKTLEAANVGNKIKKVSIVPFEMWFVGGVFTVNLYHVQMRKVKHDKTENDTIFYPILNISIYQPNAMITQTIFERTVQMSIFDISINFGSEPELLKKTEDKFADILFQTKQGELDSHGIPQPLIKVRLGNNIIRDSDLEVELKRPIKFSLSHKIIEKLYSLQLIFGEFTSSDTPKAPPADPLKPINNNFKMKNIRSKLNGIKRIKFSTSQVLLRISRVKEYNLNISFIKFQIKFEVFDRPEKFTFHLLLKGLMANTYDYIMLHPFSIDVLGNIFQETWNKHPSLFFTLKSTCLALQLCPDNILYILKLKNSFERSLKIFDRKIVPNPEVAVDDKIKSKPVDQTLSFIQIPTPKLQKKPRGQEEYYQDDLRAGAFQFIEAHSENDLPLPYQILIINVKDSGIICWRYPQPRTLNHIKVYPVPFHTTTGINIKCKLEYYSDPHTKFLPYCDFELSEIETKILELPRRKVTSSIWRVIMVQSMVAVNSEYFDDSEEMENQFFKRSTKIKNINEILMKPTTHIPEDYLDDHERQSLFHLHPKALVACMQVDSCFNPILVPNIQAVIDISQIRLNLLNNVRHKENLKTPKIFKNYTLAGDIPRSHLFFVTYINNFNLNLNMYDDMDIVLYSELNLACEIIDYAFLTMQSLVENFNFQFYIELNDEIIINLMTSNLKLRYGPSIGHALLVSEQLWRQILTEEFQCHIVLTRFVICNETMISIRFGQPGTDEILELSPKSCLFYAFRSEGYEQKLCFVYDDDVILATTDPILLGLDGVQYAEFNGTNKYIVIKTEKLSPSQKKITIRGQIDFVNMTKQEFLLEYKTDEEETDAKYKLDKKSPISLIRILQNPVNDAVRIKIAETDNGWSGYIPLKKPGKSNVPWLVKVPTTTPNRFVSFWIRVLTEDFPLEILKPNRTIPQRVLITIWPLFMVRSLLTIDTMVSTFNNDETENLKIEGRGEINELTLAGTHEDDHELIFKTPFSSSYEEDKQRALLSYNYVDKNKLFQIPNRSIEQILEQLDKPVVSNWPCSREEELRWNREISDEEPISPIFNYTLSQEWSCSLMLNILPWCLFINSTCTTLELVNIENQETYRIYENAVSMPFMISDGFTISIQETSSWKTSSIIFLKPPTRKPKSNEFLVIPEEGSILINIYSWEGNSKFVLSSTNENGVKILTLSAYYVITNFTKYQLSGFLYSINFDEKQDLALPLDTSPVGLYNFPPNKSTFENSVGTPINNFYNLSLNKNSLTKNSFFASIRSNSSNVYSCPINLTNPFNRKSICLPILNVAVPLTMSLIEYNSQMYLSLYQDNSPALEIINMTELSLYVAQSDTIQPHGHALGLTDCLGANFNWYQTIDGHSTIYYTPLGIDNQFPEIKSIEIAVLFGLITETNTIHWSQPIEISESKNIFLKIPNHGDVKIMVDCDYPIVKLFIQNVSETQEFCLSDIRSRLVNRPVTNETSLLQNTITDYDNSINDPNLPSSSDSSNNFLDKSDRHSSMRPLLQKFECANRINKNMRINCYLSEFTIVLFNDYDKKLSLKSEVVAIHLNNITLMYDKLESFLKFNCFNFQIDNLRYETKLYDFPVILCSQENFPIINLNSNSINMFTLDYNIQKILNNKQLLNLSIQFYKNNSENMKIEKIKINIYPIRAYLEDTFINYAIDFALECLPNNLIYNDNTYNDGSSKPKRINLSPDSKIVLIPQLIGKQSLNLSETFTLKSIKIETLSILLSVHTAIRMYIALDHSPLQFSAFERHNLNTLPMKLGYVLGKHYLEGAAIGAGWVVGSLEILGSPSGLARSFTIGLRDFVSMPMQGLFRGPWGFLVGLTQGSASLIRNVTAGTVNSVSKLAASVSRNLDWLTHDEEHLMITDAIRRSRPQGVTEGLTQGLTGFGISLLGAVGGLARHPLEAKSAAGVFAGVGKGIVGAFTKPLSGAAELVALTGQGVLHSVGYNTLPIPRTAPSIKSATLQPATCKLSWKITSALLTEDRILFSALVTLNLKNGYKPVLLCLTEKVVTFLSIDQDEIIEIISINKIKPSININDPTLISLKTIRPGMQLNYGASLDPETNLNQLSNDEQRLLFVSPRTYQFVRDSNEQLSLYGSSSSVVPSLIFSDITDIEYVSAKCEDRIEFYIDQDLGEYFIRYLSIINRCFVSDHILYSPLDPRN